MTYIVCNQKKKGHKVHVSVCERCRGVECPDYLNYAQPSLFPSFFQEIRDERKPFAPSDRQKRKGAGDVHGEQMALFKS